MLWPLTLVAVRQQHHKARELSPLFPARGDELVHRYLSGVGEVSELGLPQDQSFPRRHAETVLEPQDRHLREW